MQKKTKELVGTIGSLVNSHFMDFLELRIAAHVGAACKVQASWRSKLPTFQRWLSFIMIYHDLELQN